MERLIFLLRSQKLLDLVRIAQPYFGNPFSIKHLGFKCWFYFCRVLIFSKIQKPAYYILRLGFKTWYVTDVFALTQMVLDWRVRWKVDCVFEKKNNWPVEAENQLLLPMICTLKVSFYVHVYDKFNIIWAINMTDNVMNINNHKLQTVFSLSAGHAKCLKSPQMVKQPVDACVRGTLPTVTNYPVSKILLQNI